MSCRVLASGARFLVALLAIREPDLDPERVAQQTFHALGAEAHHGTVSLQQVAEAPWSVAEWAVAPRFDNPGATVPVLLLG